MLEQGGLKKKTILDFFPRLERDSNFTTLDPEASEDFVIHRRKRRSHEQAELDKTVSPSAGVAYQSLVQSTTSLTVSELSPSKSKRPLSDVPFTPVKSHKAASIIRGKKDGLHDGNIVATPSKSQYMYKTFGPSQSRCNRDIIHELAAGNLVRSYMGKSRAPVIGLCSSTFENYKKFGLSSAMFQSFIQLRETEWHIAKPVGFEEMLVVCGIIGDTDIHQRNVGYNENRELSKVDHGRAFMFKYRNGLEFLHVLTNACEANGYRYLLSLKSLREKLQFIASLGLEQPKQMIWDAFMAMSSLSQEMHDIFPIEVSTYRVSVYNHASYEENAEEFCPSSSDLSSLVQQGCLSTTTRIESWEQYNGYIVSTLTANVSIISEAVEIIQSMERNKYTDVKIKSKGRSYALHESGRMADFVFQRMV